MEKCEFHQSTISFLGYVISPEGVTMDSSKVQVMLQWALPVSVKELQCFLGFANFYRRFIRGFSSVAAPLTSLLQGKALKLIWIPSAHQAFDDLKRRFTTAPIL
ncbi:uncharacterized protein LOC127428025 [Myxocyprinus asiaticus]|uniref:uncharacterized protein LOC127428025 n=1 Tax=Myxocyprinus asiaticus TaxID=70543 RepID=UPI002222D477|nr:uncharacterized protein LOC127428025 [Myxocyprinus asiaticus]